MPQQQQQQQGQDRSMDFLWILAFIIGAVLLTWFFGKVYIISGVFHVRIYEITAINFVLNALDGILPFINFTSDQLELNNLLMYIKQYT